jgi:uncharacterized protein
MNGNLAIAQKYLERVANLDIQGAFTLLADDAIFYGPDGQPFDKTIMKSLFGPGSQLINPIEQQIVGTTCEGDRVAVEATGKTVLANGNTYRNVYHFLFEVRGGKIVTFKEYCNTKAIEAFSSPLSSSDK